MERRKIWRDSSCEFFKGMKKDINPLIQKVQWILNSINTQKHTQKHSKISENQHNSNILNRHRRKRHTILKEVILRLIVESQQENWSQKQIK